MFERFTREARAAVIGAQELARDTSSRRIDTRHLAVAILEGTGPAREAFTADADTVAATLRAALEADGLDRDALASLGIDLEVVERKVDAVFGPGALDRVRQEPRAHIPFTRDAKKALQLALRETIRLEQKRIHSGHLLLGILRADCPARTLLIESGIDIDALRHSLEIVEAA